MAASTIASREMGAARLLLPLGPRHQGGSNWLVRSMIAPATLLVASVTTSWTASLAVYLTASLAARRADRACALDRS